MSLMVANSLNKQLAELDFILDILLLFLYIVPIITDSLRFIQMIVK